MIRGSHIYIWNVLTGMYQDKVEVPGVGRMASGAMGRPRREWGSGGVWVCWVGR